VGRWNRRRLGRALPLALGAIGALAAACRPTLHPPAPNAGAGPLTAATGPQPAPAPFFPARPTLGRRGSAKLEYATLPAGGRLTLLERDDGPGFVSHLWLALNCGDPAGRDLTRYRIRVDGETAPSVDSTLAGFHAADYLPNTNFATRLIGYNRNQSEASYYTYLPIPFARSIAIEVVNGSTHAAATLFAIADYHTGVALDWGRMGKLHTVEQVASVAPYAWHGLLNLAGQPAGVLWGVYLRLHAGDPSFAFLEGNLQMVADGVPCYESSGTEDYFNNAWYFQTGVIFAEHSGCTLYDPTNHAIGAYRFHLDDPVPFERALQVRWQNGDATEAKVQNPTSMRSHVWYYTANCGGRGGGGGSFSLGSCHSPRRTPVSPEARGQRTNTRP
jgi:hypothetical protein